MTTTQFSMVEELASLIKDNLSCKHLVLTVEGMLVDSLMNNEECNSDGIIELEPMSSYNRLMLHRLADIFGFAHESVGEGDDRHLVLQKCPDSSIPLVLVSDILSDYDGYQPPTSSGYILKRASSPQDIGRNNASLVPSLPIEERETAYDAARERIFSLHLGVNEEQANHKPRPVPAAARRMISHALGKRLSSSNPVQKSTVNSGEVLSSHRAGTHKGKSLGIVSVKKTMENSENRSPLEMDKLERERAGAARRFFANALGLGPAKP